MNPLKRLLRPSLTAAKRYMLDGLQCQLEGGLEKLNRATQDNTKAIQSLAASIHKLESGNHGTEARTPPFDFPLNAAQLLELNNQIAQHLPLLQACESILACPITLSATRAFFPDKNILHGVDATALLSRITSTKVKGLGISSPWLFHEILKQPHGLHTLLQACSRDLLFIVDTESLPDQANLRQALHRVGFYNVSIITSAGTEDFISTGCLASGEFLLAGSGPALPQYSRRWSAHKATRAPDITAPEMPWNSILSTPFQQNGRGFTAEASGFALAIHKVPASAPVGTLRINGIVTWADAPSADHASLVGSYYGPGDARMYAGMIQLSSGNQAVLSLWVHHGAWERLAATTVPAEAITSTDGVFSLPLWLEIAPSQIKAGSGGTVFIEANNNSIQRTPYVGIRVSGNAIAVSYIHCTVNKP